MEGLQAMKGLLEDFGASIGMGRLVPDENGYTCLSVDDSALIHLSYDEASDALRVFSELCAVPPSHGVAVMRALLDANVLWRGCGGATLGLDPEKKMVTLACQTPIGLLSPAHVEHVLEAFLVVRENWMTQIADIVRTPVEEPLARLPCLDGRA